MAFAQTSYPETAPKALPGMVAHGEYLADTRVVETAAGIGPGLAVSQGTADKQALLGAAAATDFAGISIRNVGNLNATSPDVIPQYDNIAVLFQGDIWVTVGGDVNAGDNVTFNSTTGVLSSEATSGTQFEIARARWMTSASNGGLAMVRIDGLPAA